MKFPIVAAVVFWLASGKPLETVKLGATGPIVNVKDNIRHTSEHAKKLTGDGLAQQVMDMMTHPVEALPGKTSDGGIGLTQQISAIMAESQQKLAKAQRVHDKMVKKMKKRVSQEFADEAQTIGTTLSSFAKELKRSEAELWNVINASKVELAQDEERSDKLQGEEAWETPGSDERAKLYAQIEAAENALTRQKHSDARAVSEVEETVGSAMEDAAQSLSMKVGDLAETSAMAERSIHHLVKAVKVPVLSHSLAPNSVKQAEGFLEAARKTSKNDIKAATKKVNVAIDIETKEVAAKAKAVQVDVDAASKKIIETHLGGPHK